MNLIDNIIIGVATIDRDKLKGVDRRKNFGIDLARRAIKRMPLLQALETEWTKNDAHFVQYFVAGEEWSDFPRINDGGICEFEEAGIDVWVTTLFLDIDSEDGKCDHVWDTTDVEAVKAAVARYKRKMPTAGFYSTGGGLRAVQPLVAPVRWHEARAIAKAWRRELRGAGVVFDEKSTVEPGRFMRAPHVNRCDKKTGRPQGFKRALVCDWSDMEPIMPSMVEDTHPELESVTQRREKRERVERIIAEREPTGVERWGVMTDKLAHALKQRKAGTGHSAFLALAGALLQLGVVGPDDVVGFVVEVAEKAGEYKWEDRRRTAINTAERWMADEHVAGLESLYDNPEVMQALQFCSSIMDGRLAQVKELSEAELRLADFVRETTDWVRVAAADCGVGKTEAAKRVAVDNAKKALAAREAGRTRDPLGAKTVFLVPTTALANEFYQWFRGEGIPVQRWFGPLSYEGEGACRKREKALPVVQSGQSMRKVLCGKCEFKATCKAFEGFEGDEHPLVVVAPHAMASKALAWAGKTGLVVFDEPNAPVESVGISDEEWNVFKKNLGAFSQNFRTVMLGVVEEMERDGWDGQWHAVPLRALRAAFRGDPDAVDASYARGGPPWRAGLWSQVEQGWVGASAVYTATRVARVLWDTLRFRAEAYEEALPERVEALTPRVKRTDAGWVIQRWQSHWATVVGRMERVCVLDAGAEIYAAEYTRFLGGVAPEIYVARVGDAAEVERCVSLDRSAKRSTWFDEQGNVKDVGAVVDGLKAAVTWAKSRGLRRVGLFTWKKIREAFEAGLAGVEPGEDVLRRSIMNMIIEEGATAVEWQVGNYGATRGSNRWMGCDGLVTVGDPRPNIGDVTETLEFAGVGVEVRERVDAIAREELNQAHGRLRTVRRERKAWALHVGRLVPGGTGWELANVCAA